MTPLLPVRPSGSAPGTSPVCPQPVRPQPALGSVLRPGWATAEGAARGAGAACQGPRGPCTLGPKAAAWAYKDWEGCFANTRVGAKLDREAALQGSDPGHMACFSLSLVPGQALCWPIQSMHPVHTASPAGPGAGAGGEGGLHLEPTKLRAVGRTHRTSQMPGGSRPPSGLRGHGRTWPSLQFPSSVEKAAFASLWECRRAGPSEVAWASAPQCHGVVCCPV